MKIYRIHKLIDNGVSAGYDFFSSKRLAEKAVSQHNKENGPEDTAELSLIEVKPTRKGIIAALRRYASHPDNG